MRIKVVLKVETEHFVDLEGIAELTQHAWIHRKNVPDEEFENCECTLVKTEDGYWRTIFRPNNK